MSSFEEDLGKEQILSHFLDEKYKYLNLDFERVSDLDSQFQGVDLILKHKGLTYYVDEKAQLDYLNASLPTFTFELSYLKGGTWKKGWLFDDNKITNYYFLITAIHTSSSKLKDGFTGCIITSVNKSKLISYLKKNQLDWDFFSQVDAEIRASDNVKNLSLPQLNPKKEGCIHFSSQKAEKPLNLKLYIQWLINIGLAKRLYVG